MRLAGFPTMGTITVNTMAVRDTPNGSTSPLNQIRGAHGNTVLKDLELQISGYDLTRQLARGRGVFCPRMRPRDEKDLLWPNASVLLYVKQGERKSWTSRRTCCRHE
jgi:hypothetical protein